jgi:uncharacterized membrane protein
VSLPQAPQAPHLPEGRWTDHAVEQLIGRLLQVGVLLAALVVVVGGVLLLMQHGSEPVPAYAVFHGEPDFLTSIVAIGRGALAGNSAAIVQFGLLLLIATPIARVAFTLVAFALQRDRTYVGITMVVLALLLYGLLYGQA